MKAVEVTLDKARGKFVPLSGEAVELDLNPNNCSLKASIITHNDDQIGFRWSINTFLYNEKVYVMHGDFVAFKREALRYKASRDAAGH